MTKPDSYNEETSENIISAVTDHAGDRFSLMENVLGQSRFFEILSGAWEKSGKTKADFRIVIKPNISMLLRKNDVGIYTDPMLVIHLLRLLLKRGFTNLAVVESQNLFGNWFLNRGVTQIAAQAGYFGISDGCPPGSEVRRNMLIKGDGVEAQVPLVDMTHEMIFHDCGEPIGPIPVGRTWAEADFRVNMAKMKTHFYCYLTLAIKNIYGCLPHQDKVRNYHCNKKVGLWTAHLIKAFPVHFSIIDGYDTADGWLGVKMKAVSKKTHTMVGGADILAVDHLCSRLLKVAPEKSIFFRELLKLLPMRPYKVLGNAVPFSSWRNVPFLFVWGCALMERNANLMDYAGSLATGGYDTCFPHKKPNRGLLKRILYYLTVPVNVLMDLGIFRLRIREWLFARRLAGLKGSAPLVAGSDFFLSSLAFFSDEDVKRLAGILDAGLSGRVSISGHYFFVNGSGLPFLSRLHTTGHAAAGILNHIFDNKMDAGAFAAELKTLVSAHPGIFGTSGYPYCYS
jgi:hypothetical protein